MPNAVKYSTTNQSGSIRSNNIAIGNNNIEYGPTAVTGWYNGVTPPDNKYVIYEITASGNPKIYVPNDDVQFIRLARNKGSISNTVAGSIQFFASQSGFSIANKNYPNIVTSGSQLLLDASYVESYPTTGSTWYDISGNNTSGSLINGPLFNSNGYITFDGVDDSCTFPINTFNSGSPQQGTFYIRMKFPTLNTSSQTVLFNDGGNFGSTAVSLYRNSNFNTNQYNWLIYSTGSTGGGFYLQGTAYLPGRWYDTTFTFNSTGTGSIYRNGELINSSATVGGGNFISWKRTGNNTPSFTPASSVGTGSAQLFQGYNRPLTQQEILQNYYQGPIVTNGLVFAADAGNLVSYESGSTITYSLTGSFSGSLLNGTSYSQTNGGVFTFDGTNDYIQIPYNNYWDTNVFGTATNFTISCWAKPNLFMNWDTLITKNIQGWYSSPEGASIWTDANGFQGVFSSGVLSNPAGSTVILSYATTNTQKWYHVCFTGDGTTLRLYVDGIQRATGLVASRTVPVVTASVGPSFGLRDYWNGQMTGMMFYTRGITAEEVAQNFTAQQNRFI
jgi:hypothetical protein